jgi:hypothetical protein
MDLSSSQWFFSTCAQTFGAMVGVLGMFVVFLLQVIRDQLVLTLEQMRSREPHPNDWRPLPEMLLLKAVAERAAEFRSRNQNWDALPLEQMLALHEYAVSIRREIKTQTKLPTIALLSLIVLSLAFLWVFSFLGVQAWSCWRVVAAGMVILASSFVFWKIGKLVLLAVQFGSREDVHTPG